MKRTKTFLSLVVLLLSGAAQANIIYYELDFVSGNTWQYTYTVDNSAGTFDVEEFSIYFEPGLFENLRNCASPTGWDCFEVQPDAFIPDDGWFDSFYLTSVLGIGDILGGFSVMFDYLGTGTPGTQFFEFFDVDFEVLGDGFTVLRERPVTVPEPSTVVLLCIGLFAMFLTSRRRKSELSLRYHA